jgi:survival-of-motor-neuron-related-splicing factor 30
VISAAADINPALANQARQEPGKVGDASGRPAKVPRKVKANKELEAGKNKWQNFAAKGKGKFGKKDSMFRTGESVNARGMYLVLIDGRGVERRLTLLSSGIHGIRSTDAQRPYADSPCLSTG